MKTKAKVIKRKNRSKVEICAYCDVEAARPVLLNHTFGSGPNMVVVTDVLTFVCDHCGQSYFKGDTLKQLDEVLSSPGRWAVKKPVMVASLNAA